MKTKYAHGVLLNDKALRALQGALAMTEEGDRFMFKPTDGRGSEFIASEDTPSAT